MFLRLWHSVRLAQVHRNQEIGVDGLGHKPQTIFAYEYRRGGYGAWLLGLLLV